MKIRKYLIILLIFLGMFSLGSCKNQPKKEKIKLAEVAHSVFYAPQYVAIELGYFEEEGLNIELINANGADKVTAALLSGEVQIGLQGPEPTIYLYNNNSKDYLINFAQVTSTDGSFIFGREPIENFDITMLKGKSILGGRAGGVPEMTLEYVIKQAGLTVSNNELTQDVNVRTDVAFAAMAGSFLNGEGDFTTLFEPTASEMVASGKLYLLASVGELAGDITYTAYSCNTKYFEKNKETLKKFMRALYRGQQYVWNHSDTNVATVIKKQFKDTDLATLTSVVKRYRDINAWCKNPILSENGFKRLQDIMIEAGELKNYVEFEKLVDTSLATEIVKK